MLLLLHLFRLLRFFVVFCKCLTLCLSRGQWRGKTAKEEQQAALRVSSRRLSPWLCVLCTRTCTRARALIGRARARIAWHPLHLKRTGEAFFSSSLVIFLPPSMGQGLGSCWAGRTSQRPRREMPQPCWCEYLVPALDLRGGTCARTSDFAGAVSLCLHSWALVTRHIFGDSLAHRQSQFSLGCTYS
ncbi:hypothetical protein CI102_13942 [Trichoderma harzianum]|nr:hypothetical protein CI102_13942 [Trichoderma harzianum]